MRLSFSTRGWMDLEWNEILDSACEMRFTGIEVYNVFKSPGFVDAGGPFHKFNVMPTYRDLRDKRIEIPCFDSSNDLSKDDPEMLDEMARLI